MVNSNDRDRENIVDQGVTMSSLSQTEGGQAYNGNRADHENRGERIETQ